MINLKFVAAELVKKKSKYFTLKHGGGLWENLIIQKITLVM